jgi:hypothetical protein
VERLFPTVSPLLMKEEVETGEIGEKGDGLKIKFRKRENIS